MSGKDAQSAFQESAMGMSWASIAPKPSREKPLVVGVYGLPGSGKSHLLKEVSSSTAKDEVVYFDGSECLASYFNGDLKAFQNADPEQKREAREAVIRQIGTTCKQNNVIGVVAGHLMFWNEHGLQEKDIVWTTADAETYTHIIYLNTTSDIIAQRQSQDRESGRRHRPPVSTAELGLWQEAEKTALQKLCRNHGILFSLYSQHVQPDLPLDHRVLALLRDIRNHTEETNLKNITRQIDEAVDLMKDRFERKDPLETFLVLDGDKTLTEVDTGALFWDAYYKRQDISRTKRDDPLRSLFQSPMGYSYAAFRQASIIYEEEVTRKEFDEICNEIATTVEVHGAFYHLIDIAIKQSHIGIVIVTCGLGFLWSKVVETYARENAITVVGGGRLHDPAAFVVTAEVKAQVVRHLQEKHGGYVWAFGDSPLDLLMLEAANQAVVVVGRENSRSKSMDGALEHFIKSDRLFARQTLLPNDASPRQDPSIMPIIDLYKPDDVGDIVVPLASSCKPCELTFLHATEKPAAKLLMTPTRDAKIAGPSLREAHRRVGQYLALEYVSGYLGLGKVSIQHVQGHETSGHELSDEDRTCIVALMRGGEPMAFGVNDIFPKASFVHAKKPRDLAREHLEHITKVILVDSVVNSGKSVAEFVRVVRWLKPRAEIVVVAGVVQAKALCRGEYCMEKLAAGGKIGLVALRLSENKFTGKGGTDTGNRLFNTTDLD